jgi:CubicO group peptidase (beta-lactamase class C family)
MIKIARRKLLKLTAWGGTVFMGALSGCAGTTTGGSGQVRNSGGWSKERLGRMRDAMAGYVQRGEVPGIVTLVGRHGEMQVDALGTKAVGGKDPMRRDTIFRITSMTKPITAVATMILVEENKLRLEEPVDRLLPELANRKVLKRVDGPLDDTVPANRPITVRDLLTFTMGFGQFMAAPDASPIQKAVSELKLLTLGPPTPPSPLAPDEWIRRLATLPLMHHPGEKWMYNTGAQVLGVLIARASGQPLETFFRKRIFEPLRMKDTGFSVPPSELDRLATSYRGNPSTGKLAIFDGADDSQWSHPPAFPDGAAGLVSTIDDFGAFGQMMLNQGMYGTERILSKSSVESMTTNRLTPEQKAGSEAFLGDRGWGFGMGVVIQGDAVSTIPGRFGWDGGYGTSWASDPKQDMVGILMTQRLWDSPSPPTVCRDFWTSAYRAIDDSGSS